MAKKLLLTIFIVLSLVSVTSCNSKKSELEKVNQVIEMIDKLPNIDEVTIESENSINEVRIIYDTINKKYKEKVSNIVKLEKLEDEIIKIKKNINYQEQANSVINMIDGLPNKDDITIKDEEKIILVVEAYKSIDPLARTKVTNYDKLELLQARLAVLKKEANYNAKAFVVVDMINNLPKLKDFKLEDAELIIEIREAYNRLNTELQGKVYNYYLIYMYEERISQLKLEEINKEEINKVIKMIDDLPNVEDLTLDDEIKVIEVRNAYKDLDSEFKYLISNINKLTSLEQRIAELKKEQQEQKLVDNIISLINELPEIENVCLDDEMIIQNVRDAYEKLTEELKKKVINYDKLEKLEDKIFSLKPYEVKYYLYDGILDEASKITKPVLHHQFSVSYCSTGYWQYYGTEIFIYKTSLINSTDSYTYAYKIGFEYDENINKYVVRQVIGDDTALIPELRICEYYLFVHATNLNDYTALLNVEVGDIIEINKQIPNYSSSDYDGEISIYDENDTYTTEYSIANYQGEKLLPTPIKKKYRFIGWYDNEECVGEKITSIKGPITLYAAWEFDPSLISPTDMIDCVSDIASSNTKDVLIGEDKFASYEWSSSNPNLYIIENGYGTVSKRYQTRKAQTVEISVKITYHTGEIETKTKEIIVNPVLYDDLPDTPIATYFYSAGMDYYKLYSKRYQNENTIFSATTQKVLNIVYYAFAPIDADGSIKLEEPLYVEEVLKLKENGTRVILCVDGVTKITSKNFETLTADPLTTQVLVNNIVDLVEKYNFDGVDIDWENTQDVSVNATGMNRLMEGLRLELDNRTDIGGTKYFLSCAVPAGNWSNSTEHFDYYTLNKFVDYINLMSYNMNNNSITSHQSPMYTSSFDNGYGFGCYHGAKRFLELGWPNSKLLIGGSGYGKGYKVTGTSINKDYPGLGVSGYISKIPDHPGSLQSGTVMRTAIKELLETSRYQKYIEYNKDNQIVGSYIYSETDRYFVTYDSGEVIVGKYHYANQVKGMGIMYWCYPFDTEDELPNSLYQELMG